MKFPFYEQLDSKDCGIACLRMIAKFYGVHLTSAQIAEKSELSRDGMSLLQLEEIAKIVGFDTLSVHADFEKIKREAHLPCLALWRENHYVIIYRISKGKVHVADPAHGLIKYNDAEFLEAWQGTNNSKAKGFIILLSLSEHFDASTSAKTGNGHTYRLIVKHLYEYRALLSKLLFGLILGSLLSLIVPFLTQSLVDYGIRTKDLNFVTIILVGQLFVFAGRLSIEIIRSWIILQLSTRLNLTLISDFFAKLMSLPISYFDTKRTGDFIQRMNDHKRIETLLTTQSISVLFSAFNILLFGALLAWYNLLLFLIFLGTSVIYLVWVSFFLKRRKELDYKNFSRQSEEQSKVIELLQGMQEIKLHNAENQKRWGWERIQAKLFEISKSSLILEQFQSIGANFLNEIKNILITVLAASLVIKGEITLGMMMSVLYINGQLNSPLQQIAGFVFSVQDVKIAFERLSDIQSIDSEDYGQTRLEKLAVHDPLVLNDVSFKYKGSSKPVLNNISMIIPDQKITAIVGASGSGKTTLMKMLLKFYEPDLGSINFGRIDLKTIPSSEWREKCGVVMQEGYIFNDTIANNIALGKDTIDEERMRNAAKIANIEEFVASLPQGYNSTIGIEGTGLSTGQKQRILIARAVYKNPDILFFDEATSALDAINEKEIMQNLNTFFKGRTVVIIAHRLSTVMNADQIVLLENGAILESGNHTDLISAKGAYYKLVRNQLDVNRLNKNDE